MQLSCMINEQYFKSSFEEWCEISLRFVYSGSFIKLDIAKMLSRVYDSNEKIPHTIREKYLICLFYEPICLYV